MAGEYQSKWTGAEIDSGIEKANNALPKSGGTITGNVILDNSTTSQKDKPNIKWGTYKGNTPYIGFATDVTDGTFMIGSLKGTNYKSGLAMVGSDDRLLWKGKRVVTADELTSLIERIEALERAINNNESTTSTLGVAVLGEMVLGQ